MYRVILLLLLIFLVACRSSPQTLKITPTSIILTNTPQPPTHTAIPTSTPTRAQHYVQVAKDGAISWYRSSSLPAGVWNAEAPLTDTVFVTLPLGTALSTEQFVRMAKTQISGVVYRLFNNDKSLMLVTVAGTMPDGTGNTELPAVVVKVTREEFNSWDGKAESLSGWDIKPRYRTQ